MKILVTPCRTDSPDWHRFRPQRHSGVEIDKSGYDIDPERRFPRQLRREVRGDFNDLPTSDSDISISTGGAGSIKDPTVANENIVGLHLSIGPAQPQ